MSSIKTTQIDGDVSVGRNVAIGGKARVAGSATIGHNLKVEGWLEAPNIKDINNKGLFASSSALEAAYPTPRVGWWAMVGDSSPFAIYRCNSAGTWTATGGTASVSLTIDAETIAGWVSISSTSELPEDPTDDERGKGYLLGTVLYVYVGTGGDTLDGLYQSAQLKGQKGDTGNTVQLGEAVIADNLTTDDAEKVLSAKQGKVLKGLIDNIEIPVVNDLTTGGEEEALSAEQGKRLKGMIDNLGTLDSEGVGLADVTLSVKFSLVQNLTDVTSSVDAESVDLGDVLNVRLTPASGYTIGPITVLMGGVDITSTAYSNMVVYISEVTGDVSITAIGVEQGVVPLVFADSNVEAVILANFPHENENFITEAEAAQITDLNKVFKDNTQITSFNELSKFGVTKLRNSEFYGCTALESIDLSNIDSIGRDDEAGSSAGQNCFRYCSSLTKVVLNSNITNIPANCFRDCTSLAVFDASGAIDTWGGSAVANCAFTKIILRSTTPCTYTNALRYPNCTLYVPDALMSAYAETNWVQNNDYPITLNTTTGRQIKPLSEYVED